MSIYCITHNTNKGQKHYHPLFVVLLPKSMLYCCNLFPSISSESRLKILPMAGLGFLCHNHLHKIHFHFLEIDDIVRLRAIHSSCDALVLQYARRELQEVHAQDFSSLLGFGRDLCDGVTNTVHVSLVSLLTNCGGNTAEVIRLFWQTGPYNFRQAIPWKRYSNCQSDRCSVCAVMTESTLGSLQCLDLAMAPKQCARLVPLVAKPGSPLLLLPVDVWSVTEGISDDLMKPIALNCLQLQSLNVGYTKGMITDAFLKLIGTNSVNLRSLDVSNTYGQITDESSGRA